MSRIATLINMYKVLKDTGVYFLVKSSAEYHCPTASDDLGYFFYTIFLGNFLNLAPLQASQLFFYLGVAISFIIITIAFLGISKSYVGYGIVLLCMIRLTMPLLYLNPPYIAYLLASAPIAIILFADFYSSKKAFLIAAIIGGFLGSVSDEIRSFSAFPLFVFCFIYLLFNQKWPIKRKITFIVLFSLSYSIPCFHCMYHMKKRNKFLTSQGVLLTDSTRHVFWHNIYTGLGFLNNNENIIWNDTCAINRALGINSESKYPSVLYEQTIRNEIFRLCKEKRYFVATTIFAKLGVILYFFLIYFGLFGVLCSWFYPKPLRIELAFWASLGVSALPGILTLPVVAYLIGFIAITIMYTMYSSLYALKNGMLTDISKLYYKKFDCIKRFLIKK